MGSFLGNFALRELNLIWRAKGKKKTDICAWEITRRYEFKPTKRTDRERFGQRFI